MAVLALPAPRGWLARATSRCTHGRGGGLWCPAYLKSNIFQELLRMSEEEFGVPVGDRPITLPCDAAFMEHVVASLRDARWKKPCATPFLLTRA
ncbi:Auxin responsive protein [Musa troglodytarum]|uniref:Auxin responsive protein n=2 Tax=Musa troglodytarum TaxID=320322 RepID=A0A9E7K6R8_9LILI|nr:Auxin responsive protein [Musa troglodytarum]